MSTQWVKQMHKPWVTIQRENEGKHEALTGTPCAISIHFLKIANERCTHTRKSCPYLKKINLYLN